MTAKEYLSQARYLDNRIKSKLLQIDSLNELATRCTPSYSDMPKSPNREGSRMESAILDIIELEDEISKDGAGGVKEGNRRGYQTGRQYRIPDLA